MTALSSPAALRNRQPILDVLRPLLPPSGLVLEVASGTGEHVAHFARALPGLTFQPSDPDADARASVRAYCTGLPNVLPIIELDAAASAWAIMRADAIICINMVHIAPWAATEGLMAGAARILTAGGLLYLYGPFIRPGNVLEPSNAAFDESLRARDTRWGLRDLGDVEVLAASNGLRLDDMVTMPANNLSVVFRR